MSSDKELELKKINMIKPLNLDCLKDYIELIISEDEKSFKKCLENIIYTSKLSDSNNIELNEIFLIVREKYKLIN